MCDCEPDSLSALSLLRLLVVDEHLCERIPGGLLASERNYGALRCFSHSPLKQVERLAPTRGTGGFPEPLTLYGILNPPGRSLPLFSGALVLVNGMVARPR